VSPPTRSASSTPAGGSVFISASEVIAPPVIPTPKRQRTLVSPQRHLPHRPQRRRAQYVSGAEPLWTPPVGEAVAHRPAWSGSGTGPGAIPPAGCRAAAARSTLLSATDQLLLSSAGWNRIILLRIPSSRKPKLPPFPLDSERQPAGFRAGTTSPILPALPETGLSWCREAAASQASAPHLAIFPPTFSPPFDSALARVDLLERTQLLAS